jgi:protein-disulfide isomerase
MRGRRRRQKEDPMRLKILIGAALAMLAACSGQKAEIAAPDAIDRMSKAEVEAIVKEYLVREPEVLLAAFAELERREAAAKVAAAEAIWPELIKTRNDPVLGPASAPITIVEFTDYNCGFCKSATPWVMNQVDNRRGDVRVILKESAVRGANSELAAKAALAAHRQGKYREMHVALMKVPANAYSPEIIERIGKSVGLDLVRMKKDMDDKALHDLVAQHVAEFDRAGLEGTPGFFINGKYVAGFDQESLEALIAGARQSAKKDG